VKYNVADELLLRKAKEELKLSSRMELHHRGIK